MDAGGLAAAGCRLGPFCGSRGTTTVRSSQGDLVAGPDDGRGLCWPDERHGQHAIAQLPADWAGLAAQVGKDAGRQGITALPRGGGEPPTTLRLEVEALAREIAWTLELWAEPVRERAGLHDPAGAFAYRHHWQRRRRPQLQVQQDAATLTAHYSVLLALGPLDHLTYDGEVATADGPDAVATLIGLHHRARSMLGWNRRREPRDLPCPPPPEGTPQVERHRWGCGQYSLGWDVSDDYVTCGRCGWWCTLADYDRYAMTFLPPGVRTT